MVDSRPWGQRGHFRAREVVVIAQREREREEVVGVLTNGATWRQSCGNDHTTEVVGGAPISMGRWFRARGGEIGAEVGAVDNGGALVAPFIRL
jgi:hypothetical protein